MPTNHNSRPFKAIAAHTALLLYSALALLPVLLIIVNSFKDRLSIFSQPYVLEGQRAQPDRIRLEAIRDVIWKYHLGDDNLVSSANDCEGVLYFAKALQKSLEAVLGWYERIQERRREPTYRTTTRRERKHAPKTAA